MMLPVLQRIKAPALDKDAILRAPYFEILLFRTRLRFRDPPRNIEYEANLFGEKTTDKRPFVNTVSKRHYLGEEGDGILFETLYYTGWKFFPRGWFKPAYAALHLHLVAHGVVPEDREKFPDLMQVPNALGWVRQSYQRLYQAYNEMTLKPNGEDVELVFHDPEWAKAQAQQRDFPVEQLNINGLPVLKGRPEPNRVEFYVAFSPEDILQFSFGLEALRPLGEEEKAHFTGRASAWVDAIMQTLELVIPTHKIEQGKSV